MIDQQSFEALPYAAQVGLLVGSLGLLGDRYGTLSERMALMNECLAVNDLEKANTLFCAHVRGYSHKAGVAQSAERLLRKQ